MKTTAHPKNQKGVALVITLSAIVLVTMLVLAFFVHSQLNGRISFSSAGQARADYVAQSGLQNIQGWLLAEIIAGSNVSTSSGISIYTPRDASKIIPSRILPYGGAFSGADFYNITKMSLNGSTFWAGSNYNTAIPAISPASSVNTTTASANGRSITLSRWEKPQLTFNNLASAPDWIPLHRNGVDLSGDSTTTNDVVGRFAYIVYDVSGLIDINVAGNQLSPTGASATDTLNNAKRGRMNQIDLSVFGINGSALASRRNPNSSTSTNIQNTLLSGTYNFLSVSDANDQPFVSRQDLLSFSQANSSIIPNTALPYLTVFSREKNAPTFNPSYLMTPTGPVSNLGGAGINPDLLSVRFSSTWYSIENGVTKTIPAGTPIVRKRFPLSRINLLSTNSPDIQKYFGLTGNATSGWTYPGSTIATLNTIQGRDPNFFELLKAVIKNDSLGNASMDADYTTSSPGDFPPDRGSIFPGNPRASEFYAGQGNFLEYNLYYWKNILRLYHGSSSSARVRDSIRDLQIIQIGANIIDQYDSDNIPTAITFSGTTIYGVENLPYINRISAAPVFSSVLSASTLIPATIWASGVHITSPSTLQETWQFEIWNPHFNAGVIATTSPSNFRVSLNGMSSLQFYGYDADSSQHLNPSSGNKVLPSNDTEAAAVPTPPAQITPPTSISGNISFSGTDSMNFRDATVLHNQTSGAILAINGASLPIAQTYNNIAAGILPSNNVTASLQYQNSLGAWITYQQIPINIGVVGPTSGPTNYLKPVYVNHNKIDPRTSRFGTFITFSDHNYGDPIRGDIALSPSILTQINYTTLTGPTYNNLFRAASCYPITNTLANTGAFFYSNPTYPFISRPGFLQINALNYGTYWMAYSDPDGVVRGACGYYNRVTTDNYGLPLSIGDITTPAGFPSGITPQPRGQNAGYFNRPVVLNRPFRSVGELGYVFRDQPWKNLDFFTLLSADSGLLDVFCLDDSEVVAGKVNLNTRYTAILQSLLQGASLNELNTDGSPLPTGNPASTNNDGFLLSPTDANAIATAITGMTNTTPLLNKAQLVAKLNNWDGSNSTSSSIPPDNSILSSVFAGEPLIKMTKERREAPIRALAEATQTRTWNLMIDIIAQSGRYAPNANGDASKFIVEGEKRYWLHLAIDRYTGEVIDSMLEPVLEN